MLAVTTLRFVHFCDHQATRTSVIQLAIVLFTSFLFLPHFDVIYDLLLNRCMATWNLFIKYKCSKDVEPRIIQRINPALGQWNSTASVTSYTATICSLENNNYCHCCCWLLFENHNSNGKNTSLKLLGAHIVLSQEYTPAGNQTASRNQTILLH